jgi:hypothetical protein
MTMDDNTNKKQAHKVNSNDINLDHEQEEGEIPDPVIEDQRRVKNGCWCIIAMLGISHPLDGKFCESFNQYIGLNPKE